MTSTTLLEQAAERQAEVDDAVAAYLAKGGQIESCPEKNHIKANLDYYKHRAKVRRGYRSEHGIKTPKAQGRPHLLSLIHI